MREGRLTTDEHLGDTRSHGAVRVRAGARRRWRAVHRDRWLALFVLTRGLATAAAIGLLVAHRVTGHDDWLVLGAMAAGPGAILLAVSSERVRDSPLAWSLDTLAVLALVVASEDWRSPFYLMALSTLVLPAVSLAQRPAAAWGAGFVAAYFAIAAYTGLEAYTLESTVRLETLATHLLVPLVIVLALSYSSDLLERLRREEDRAKDLAVDAERRRIAWELHDSAKQRVHAAHLIISAAREQQGGGAVEMIDQGLHELQAATADMDTSVNELHSPVDGRRLDDVLRERAANLARVSPATIAVTGETPELPPLITAHAYRIAAEAMLNAVRHSRAEHIEVTLGRENGSVVIRVSDDGVGIPEQTRPGSHGLSFMGHRAATIGASLHVARGDDSRGTTVALDIPIHEEPR